MACRLLCKEWPAVCSGRSKQKVRLLLYEFGQAEGWHGPECLVVELKSDMILDIS